MSAYAMTAPAVSNRVTRGPVARDRAVQSRAVPSRAVPSRATFMMRRAVLVLIVAAVVALIAPRAFAGADAGEAVAFDTYTVASGETLWSIASSLTSPGEDVQDMVAELQRINGMSSSTLMAGAQLYIPALD